jgi:HD-like signal output (HDOD) protein
MNFLKTRTNTVTQEPSAPATTAKIPVLEGWSESELVSVYNAAPVRHLRKGESLFADAQSTQSFFVLLEGSIQIVVKWDNHKGRPGIIWRGDCVAPLPKAPGLLYCADAIEQSTIIEITPTVLNYLPTKTQLTIYKVAMTATSRINAYIRSVNGEVDAKNKRMAGYMKSVIDERNDAANTESVRNFIANVPRLPAYVMDLAQKLTQETTSVQEVVEAIKRDPSTAGLVLRAVNSAQYGFDKKIETFYHACMILGFNNIYTLVIRDAVQAAMPQTDETKKIHTHSCLVSVLAFELSLVSKDIQGQTATTVGLLHDVGKGVKVLMKRARWMMDEYVDTLNSAKLGADLLRAWGLPPRLCQIVENQQQAEFTAPDFVPAEYRREIGLLHVAHVLEKMLLGETPAPESMIYTKDYMSVLGITAATPGDLLREKILPSLSRNRGRLPHDLQGLISQQEMV